MDKQELFIALAKAQAEIPLIEKTNTADTGAGRSYKYADIGNVLSKVQDILGKHGLSITHDEIWLESGVQLLESHLNHISGQSIKTTGLIEYDKRTEYTNSFGKTVKNNLAQARGSALTYARRYAIYNLLNLGFGIDPDDEDDDGKKAFSGDDKEQGAQPSNATNKASSRQSNYTAKAPAQEKLDKEQLKMLDKAIASIALTPEKQDKTRAFILKENGIKQIPDLHPDKLQQILDRINKIKEEQNAKSNN